MKFCCYYIIITLRTKEISLFVNKINKNSTNIKMMSVKTYDKRKNVTLVGSLRNIILLSKIKIG